MKLDKTTRHFRHSERWESQFLNGSNVGIISRVQRPTHPSTPRPRIPVSICYSPAWDDASLFRTPPSRRQRARNLLWRQARMDSMWYIFYLVSLAKGPQGRFEVSY